MSVLKKQHKRYIKKNFNLNSDDETIISLVVELRKLSRYSINDKGFLDFLKKRDDKTTKSMKKFSSSKYDILTFEEFCCR